MTPTIRSLALLTGCYLSVACSTPTEPKHEAPRPARAEKSASPLAIDPPQALTAAAPTRPASVADQPLPEPTKVEPLTLGVDKPETAGLSPLEHVDFDRPVTPAEVHVQRFVLATSVEGREPVGESDVFGTDTKEIFAFVQLENEHGAPYAFQVHFEPVDGPTSRYGVKLDVPSAVRYRTWSWTRIKREPGKYKAVLRTLDGVDIATREFTIEPAQSADQ